MIEPLRRCHRCGFVAYRFGPCHTCALLCDPIPDPLPEYPVRQSDPDAAEHRRVMLAATA